MKTDLTCKGPWPDNVTTLTSCMLLVIWDDLQFHDCLCLKSDLGMMPITDKKKNWFWSIVLHQLTQWVCKSDDFATNFQSLLFFEYDGASYLLNRFAKTFAKLKEEYHGPGKKKYLNLHTEANNRGKIAATWSHQLYFVHVEECLPFWKLTLSELTCTFKNSISFPKAVHPLEKAGFQLHLITDENHLKSSNTQLHQWIAHPRKTGSRFSVHMIKTTCVCMQRLTDVRNVFFPAKDKKFVLMWNFEFSDSKYGY